jgi:hypothetical protein
MLKTLFPPEYSQIVMVYDPWNGEPVRDGDAQNFVEKISRAIKITPHFRVDVSNSLVIAQARLAIAKGKIPPHNIKFLYRKPDLTLEEVEHSPMGQVKDAPMGFADYEVKTFKEIDTLLERVHENSD